MAKFKISTDEGTFMVDAPDEETALQAVSEEGPSLQPEPSSLKKGLDTFQDVMQVVHPMGWTQGLVDRAAEAIPSLVPGIVQSAKDAYSAPYRAYTGELPMTDESGRTSDRAIAEGFNMATWASPTSVANAAKVAPKLAPRPPSEGAQVAIAASDLGVTLPRAVTSDSATVQNVGKRLSQVPIVGNPLRNASKAAVKQLDDAAKGVQDDLGSGSRELAGSNVRRDLEKFAAIEEPENLKALYGNVERMVRPNVRIPLSETRRIAQNINARRSAAKLEGSSAVNFVDRALQTDGMSYEEIKNLRTAIGEMKKNKSELAARKIADSELDAIYNGLTTDLKNAVKAGGGNEALGAFEKANNAAREFAEDKAALNSIVGKGSDEKIVANLLAMASSKSQANIKDLALAKSKVSKGTWNELASAALKEMGRDAESKLTPDRFVTAWGNLSESGKKLLFGNNPEHLKALEDIAKVSSRFKQLNEFANPSGTGGQNAMLAGGISLGAGYFEPTVLAASVISATTGFTLSSLLARPNSAKALAAYSKAYEIAAKSPGRASQNLLADKAKSLALIAANGNREMATNLAARLASVEKTVAEDDGNEEPGGPVRYPKPDQASDDFNEAYNQGRAF